MGDISRRGYMKWTVKILLIVAMMACSSQRKQDAADDVSTWGEITCPDGVCDFALDCYVEPNEDELIGVAEDKLICACGETYHLTYIVDLDAERSKTYREDGEICIDAIPKTWYVDWPQVCVTCVEALDSSWFQDMPRVWCASDQDPDEYNNSPAKDCIAIKKIEYDETKKTVTIDEGRGHVIRLDRTGVAYYENEGYISRVEISEEKWRIKKELIKLGKKGEAHTEWCYPRE